MFKVVQFIGDERMQKTRDKWLPLIVLVMASIPPLIANYVPVIQFKTDPGPVTQKNESIEAHAENNLIRTKNVTICFRIMNRFRRTFVLIKTNQIRLMMNDDMNALYFYIRPFSELHNHSLSKTHSRKFQSCKKYGPGQWVSMCFSIKLHNITQEIAFIQDGKLCDRKTYIDGNSGFEWLYLKKSILIGET